VGKHFSDCKTEKKRRNCARREEGRKKKRREGRNLSLYSLLAKGGLGMDAKMRGKDFSTLRSSE